jgi:type I restriction enzyme, S subunit
MEVRPGYKQTEVGVIPEDWSVESLDRIADPKRSICYGIVQVGQFSDNGIAVLAIKNLNGDYLTNLHRCSYKVEKAYARSRVRPGDVLVSVKGTVGRIGLVPPHFFGNISRDLARIALTDSDIPAFWYQLLQSDMAQRRLEATTVGTTRMELSIGPLKKVEMPRPSKEEQRAIATVLSDVDVLLGALDRLIAKKRDLKTAAMQQLLTGRTRLPGFTGEWNIKTLGELFNFSGGYSASRDQLSTKGHCYLHYGDIHGASKTFVDARADYQDIPKLDIPLRQVSPNAMLNDGDVVFVDASEDDEGTSKHVVVVNKDNVPFISGLHTIVAKSKTEELVHNYLRYCFQTSAIRQQFLFYSVGTKVSGISKTNIPKLTMPVPSIQEQTAIAEVLKDMDAELASLEQRLNKTRALKQGMMQELLTGKTRLVSTEASHA